MKVDPLYKSTVTGFAFFHCGNPNYESGAEYLIMIGVWPACTAATKAEACSTWMSDRSTETHPKLKRGIALSGRLYIHNLAVRRLLDAAGVQARGQARIFLWCVNFVPQKQGN